MRSRLFSSLLFLLLLAALPAAPADAALAKRGGEVSTADACNPHPDKDDIVLPMPGGLSMAFRLVAVPSKGLLWDMSARPGRDDAANSDRAFYDRRYRAFLSAPFSRADLPAQWRAQAPAGDYFFYLVAKYEVSRLQWQSIMGNGTGEPVTDAARPVTDISWYEAVEFTRRYTEWLLQNAADALPHYAGDSRNVGFVRLPTETEWEYAARGGQTAGPEQLMEKDFFALPAGAPLADYAVYRPEGAARIAEDCARIGSRKANPLGLYDTAGNAAEMALDMFRFSVGGRLHGSAGGFVRKGGSFLSGEAEIMPGRREESAFFLADGPAHARDLGFRPVISGINTPGGDRPSALQQAWNAAGQSNPLARDASRNPLEELDRLLAAAPDANSRKNLLTLREAIKENNILQEQQQQLEMQSTLRTAVYMLETIRNYASRRNSLQSQYDSMKRDSRTAKGETLAALRRIMKTAEQGLEQFQTGIDRSLSFYRTRVEEAARLDKNDFERALASLLKDYAGEDLFNENMRRNAELLRRHVQSARAGRLPADPGGDRPSALQQAWNAAGQSNPLARDASRNPLEELDRLLAAAPDANSRKNLLTLREAIKENNILQEQQQQLEMQSTLRTAVYMLETIRNYASRRNSLQSQYDSMKRDSRTAKGETLAALRRIMKTAEQGLEQFQTGIDRSLSFYRTRVEEAARLDKNDFERALASLLKDYAGEDLFNENMRRNAELLRRHVQSARAGRLPADKAMLQEILQARTGK